MSTSLKLVQDSLEQENRTELDRVLASPSFRRAPALCKFLSYICESHFKGLAHEIKEYNIAVSALGRRPGFDPQVDPIVRVSAHSLRKRLESYYQGEGRSNPVRIVLPLGSYVPHFEKAGAEMGGLSRAPSPILEVAAVPRAPAIEPQVAQEITSPASDSVAEELVPKKTLPPSDTQAPGEHPKWPLILAVLLPALIVAAYFLLRHNQRATYPAPSETPVGVPAPLLAIRLGSGREWVDRAGQVWSRDSYCHAGSRLENNVKLISGVSDPEILAGELTGDFHCAFPVSPGSYELHLFFVDLSGAAVAAHRPLLRINGQQHMYDIICDSEGTGRTAVKVLIDVKPGADGSIHLDAANDQAFLSAVEIYRGVAGKMLPLRISASAISYVDSTGVSWLSDRYFGGGTQLQRALASVGTDRPRLYQWERYGRFSYYLPVAEGMTYTVRLYFSEGYYGRDKLVSGGPGSRVFDVFANGRTL
ncbi:MAG: malectin domain-containing carbohydrate-binding protein [Terracidiphilus sp.]